MTIVTGRDITFTSTEPKSFEFVIKLSSVCISTYLKIGISWLYLNSQLVIKDEGHTILIRLIVHTTVKFAEMTIEK